MRSAGFIERNAGIWGARQDVANRVEFVVQQTIEAVVSVCEVAGPIRIDLGFDEFVIDVLVTYDGAPLEFPTQPRRMRRSPRRIPVTCAWRVI